MSMMNASAPSFEYAPRQASTASLQFGESSVPATPNNSFAQNPVSPVSRRRMNDPYSTSNTVRLVQTPTSPTQAVSPNKLTPPSPATMLPSVSAAVPPMPALDSMGTATSSSSSYQQHHQQQQQQHHTTVASSSSTSTSSSTPSEVATTTATNTSSGAAAAAAVPLNPQEMYDELVARKDELPDLARAPNGSSMLQCAIKADPTCAALVWNRFEDCIGDLMLDANAGYVVRCLLDMAPREAAVRVCEQISSDKMLAYSLCTHSLHTRRLVQGIMESIDPNFLAAVLIDKCPEIARTQQGCIVMQRALDHCEQKYRTRLVSAIAVNLSDFAVDPFANYVVQYLLDTAPREETIPMLWHAIQGRILHLSCNKFASNVIEKYLMLADHEAQHNLIHELYSSDAESLCAVMQDSFGNYIVQATIARSNFGDLQFIDNQLRPVLELVPYGSKIAARLDRRLNGGSVSSAPEGGPRHHSHHHGHGHHGHGHGHHHHGSSSSVPAPPPPHSSGHHHPHGGRGGGYRGQQRHHSHSHHSHSSAGAPPPPPATSGAAPAYYSSGVSHAQSAW